MKNQRKGDIMDIFCVKCGTRIHNEKRCPRCGGTKFAAVPS